MLLMMKAFQTPRARLALGANHSRAGAKAVRLEPHSVQERCKEIAQGCIVRAIVRNVSPVSVATAGKDDWQITWVVGVRVPQVAAK